MLRFVLLATAALMIVAGAMWMFRGSHPKRAAPAEKPPVAATAPRPETPPPAAPPSAAPPSAAPTQSSSRDRSGWVAAPGRVEPISEEMRLGFDMAGKIAAVTVEEGDTVRQGQIVARLAADELMARVVEAEQALDASEATLAKVLAGARDMERKEARAAVDEARAVLGTARKENERRRRLVAQEVLSREEADRAEREFSVASERLDAARQHFRLVDDPAREEDVKKAMADVGQARAKVAEMRALAEKGLIRSPIDGVVLRKHRRAGEMVSVSFDTPVVTVGDIGRLRLRADVDERDIAAVRVGQKAYAMAEAYGARRFPGKVVRIAKILGRKNIRTDDPAEKNDTRILETLIDLDGPVDLPVGLRMDVFIITGARGEDHLPDYRP